MPRYACLAVIPLLLNITCSNSQNPSATREPLQEPSSPPGRSPAHDAVEAKFVSLFDGVSLAGWQGEVEDYEVVDGLLICKKGAHGSLYTDRAFSDFVLRLEYRLEPGSNNGIGIRAPVSDQPPGITGLEIQILDDTHPKHKDLKPVQFNGSIYGAVAAERGHLEPVGQWNGMEIRAEGSRIQVTLNGVRILDADMDNVGPVHMHGYDFVGLHNESGHIAICGHNDPVAFRNIRIRELP